MLSLRPSLLGRIVLISGLVLAYGLVSTGQRRRTPTKRTSIPPQTSQPTTRSANTGDGVKQRTIDTFRAYHAMQLPMGLEPLQILAFRKNAIRRLNLQNVDPTLVNYFRLLDQKFSEEVPVIKAWQEDESDEQEKAARESDRDAECERARELHEPCERDAGDALSVFSGWGGNRTAEDKWGPVFDRIEAKYTPATGAALKRLSAKYQYPFSSDGSIPPAAGNADSNNIPDSNASKPNLVNARATAPPPKRAPRTAPEFYNLGASYNKENRYQEAVGALKSALKLNPKHAEARGELGYSYRKLGLCAPAIDEYKAAVRLQPGVLGTQYGLGWCYDELKRYRDAVDPLRQSLAINQNDTDVHRELGFALMQLQQYDEASEQLQAAIRLKPNEGLSHYYQGQIFLATGNKKRAQEEYRALKKIDAARASQFSEELKNGVRIAEDPHPPATITETQPVPAQPQKDSPVKRELKSIWNQIKKKPY
jgi:tetratricopeptide (TPR) repeat protein